MERAFTQYASKAAKIDTSQNQNLNDPGWEPDDCCLMLEDQQAKRNQSKCVLTNKRLPPSKPELAVEKASRTWSAMADSVQTDQNQSHYDPSVAFTAQESELVPTANSARWKQLWSQSQHAYRCRPAVSKHWSRANQRLKCQGWAAWGEIVISLWLLTRTF